MKWSFAQCSTWNTDPTANRQLQLFHVERSVIWITQWQIVENREPDKIGGSRPSWYIPVSCKELSDTGFLQLIERLLDKLPYSLLLIRGIQKRGE